VWLLKNKYVARCEIDRPNVSLSPSQLRKVAFDSRAAGSHQLLAPFGSRPKLGRRSVDDQDRASDPRIEVDHVKGVGVRKDFISESAHLRPDAHVAGFPDETALSRLDEDSIGYSNACRQRSLLDKECIDLRWLERPRESVQGLLNHRIKLLLALFGVCRVESNVLIETLPPMAVQVDDSGTFRMALAPHHRKHPAERVTGNRRVSKLQVIGDSCDVGQSVVS